MAGARWLCEELDWDAMETDLSNQFLYSIKNLYNEHCLKIGLDKDNPFNWRLPGANSHTCFILSHYIFIKVEPRKYGLELQQTNPEEIQPHSNKEENHDMNECEMV